MHLIHGGDIAGYEAEYGRPPLDFSASLNPAGMPDAVAAAAAAAAGEATPYPDPLCRKLTGALAQKLSVAPARVFCAAGAADAIFRLVLAQKPKKALLVQPTFAEYALALDTVDCEVRQHHLRAENDFLPDERLLDAVVPGIDLCFFCQPNNPTGQLAGQALLDALVQKCGEVGATLVVDECFGDFVLPEAWRSLMPRVERTPHLVILGSFTKLYGMAGIRLGYAVCGDAALPEKLRRAGQPWAVSSVAQAAGLAALGQQEYVRRSLEALHGQKALLRRALESRGMHVMGSHANFLFFDAKIPAFAKALAKRGVLIRDCANFEGLRPGHCRVAVRTAAENERLLEAVDAVLAACGP